MFIMSLMMNLSGAVSMRKLLPGRTVGPAKGTKGERPLRFPTTLPKRSCWEAGKSMTRKSSVWRKSIHCWGSSECEGCERPIIGGSVYETIRSVCAEQGYRLGFVTGSDTHAGNPGYAHWVFSAELESYRGRD